MRLIDADKLEANMYHEAFETDTDMQKWDSGCWIRYKMFENQIEKLPTVEAIPIEWLKKWAENGGDEPVDDFTDVDAYCDGYQKNVIECLLRAWEKENET